MSWTVEWSVHKMRSVLEESDEAVRRALIVLYKQQTRDERMADETIERNCAGFNKVDAEFGSELARIALHGGKLSDRQIQAARKMVMKYANQLTRLHNSGVKAFGQQEGERKQ